jgi:23S rRNA (uracil1939-C5)-methyltransferase
VLRPLQGPTWGYRHRARLSVRHVTKKGEVLVGFHERQSRYVADMKTCPVLPPGISALLPSLRALIGSMAQRDRLPQIELAAGDDVIVLVLRHLEPLPPADLERLRAFGAAHGVQWWLQPGGPDSAHPLDDAQALAQPLAYGLPEFGVRMPFRPTDFTQVNPDINRVLVARSLRLLRPQAGERVIDWFCGLGNFTLPIARLASAVHGIEGSATLVERARANASLNGLADRTSFEARNLFEIDAAGLQAQGRADRWLVDPPREGAFALAKALADAVQAGLSDDPQAWQAPRRIVYVSCNPATLARDAGLLVHQAGYRCAAAGVVNMFPHTAHTESIAVFDRAG